MLTNIYPIAQLFAVRDKRNGNYMPLATGKSGRGGSWQEPMSVDEILKSGKTIRLFKSERAAKAFINQWVKGKHEMVRTGGTSWDDEYDETVFIIAVPDRDKENLEIVAIDLVPTI